MFKKLVSALVLAALLITCIPVMAAAKPVSIENASIETAPVLFEGTITVTEDGGKYDVGFVTLHFLKRCLPKDQLPMTFDVKVFVKDGEPGIEVTPDVEKFLKPVLIKVDRYSGYLYNETTGENTYVRIRPQVVIAKHFSWYRFR